MMVLKRIALWLVGIVMLLLALLYAMNVWQDYERYREGIQGYMGLDIGASRQEATYVLGEPKYVLSETKADPKGDYQDVYLVKGHDEEYNDIPKGTNIGAYRQWIFERENYRVIVSFDPKTNLVTSINCGGYSSITGGSLCPSLYGVWVGQNEASVMSMLGDADSFEYSGTGKVYHWQRLGVKLLLNEKKVDQIERRDTATGAGIGWMLRHIMF